MCPGWDESVLAFHISQNKQGIRCVTRVYFLLKYDFAFFMSKYIFPGTDLLEVETNNIVISKCFNPSSLTEM